jgi:hypothetical protein
MHGGTWFFLFFSIVKAIGRPFQSIYNSSRLHQIPLVCPNDKNKLKLKEVISHLVELLPFDGERERGLFFCVLKVLQL